MLFQPQLCRLILNGRKTQTRRIVKPGQAGAQPRSFYRVGSSYPLERPMRLDEANELQAQIILRTRLGRPPKKEIGRLRITAVDRARLDRISFDDARAEGFKTPTLFKAYWVRLHDTRWIRRAEHEPAPGIGPMLEPRTDEQLAARFDEHWASKDVWVISFRLEPTTLYLAESPITAGQDYVTTERDQKGRQIAMTTQIDVAPALPDSVPGLEDPSADVDEDRARQLDASGVALVPEEAVHPEIIDGWQHDPHSTHQQIQRRVRAQGDSTEAHQRALDRRLLEQEDRIVNRVREAKQHARHRNINVAPEIKALRIAQERRAGTHVEQLLENLERAARP